MLKTIFLSIFILLSFFNIAFSNPNYFNEAKKKFNEKKYDESKFLFQKNIVFNPKDAKSYLYLAKIFNHEENQKEEEKNIQTSLLLNPNNEEAISILINIELKKSNYSEVKNLINKFTIVCSTLCNKTESFNESLRNIEPQNDS